jgi:hypothetical protein
MSIGTILIKTAIILVDNDLENLLKKPTTRSIQTATQCPRVTSNHAWVQSYATQCPRVTSNHAWVQSYATQCPRVTSNHAWVQSNATQCQRVTSNHAWQQPYATQCQRVTSNHAWQQPYATQYYDEVLFILITLHFRYAQKSPNNKLGNVRTA